ncbi:MAG: hypothetical protein M0P12_00150 [Paludibacteraceae bacterium]|nr:hypothetical protein [Paludibacteraceae bacterium]
MSRIIVKLKDYYFEYSTIVDAPVTYGMKRDEFEAYYRNEYGKSGMENFSSRMKRVDQKGTSSLYHNCAEETLKTNLAGHNGENLTVEEVYKFYCLRDII